MNTEHHWDHLAHQIKSCKQCDGLNSVELGTENAPGYGNKNSKIVFIGQSLCGKPCIDAQIPFTGGSGKILDQAFQKANILKHDIYITNVVKCHPVNNRKSHDHEITNCSPYLKTELDWIRPEAIVCLGKDAWNYFDEGIAKPSVETFDLNGKPTSIHYVYHPSYIMKQALAKRQHYIDYIAQVITMTIKQH